MGPKLKIYYDHQIFTLQNFGGISRYFTSLAKEIEEHADADCSFRFLYSRNGYLDRESNILNKELGEFFLRKYRKYQKWNKKYSAYQIAKGNFDLLHPTYYDPYFLSKNKKPFVITVHDMIHELFPAYFAPDDPTAYFKREVIKKAHHIIAISESTKQDLQKLLGVPENKITVVYHGLFNWAPKEDKESKQYKATEDVPYILFVGDRAGYKNFYGFTTAFSQIASQYSDIKLMLAGGGKLRIGEIEHLKGLKIENRVTQLDVADNVLKELYRKALFFCYPSFYEGFGLPILEAFNCGCPVTCSNTSCFYEVGGNAVAYFNPYDIEEMVNVFQSLIEKEGWRVDLVSKGVERLQLFSGQECLNKTLACYQKCIG